MFFNPSNRNTQNSNLLKSSNQELQNIPTAPLQRGKTPPPNECPGYDTKQSDGGCTVMLELWGVAEFSLHYHHSQEWPGVVAIDRVYYLLGQIELNCVLMLS